MSALLDAQTQSFCDNRIRKHNLLAAQLAIAFQDNIRTVGDVYQYLNGQAKDANGQVIQVTFVDTRQDAPPHFMSAADILACNAFYNDILTAMTGHASWPVVEKSLVNPLV